MFTDPVLERMRLGKDSFFKQSETYEHLGDVETYVIDMHARYEEMKAS